MPYSKARHVYNRVYRYEIDYPSTTLYNIKILQDFTIDIAYGINRAFGNPIIGIGIVIIYLKDLSGSLKDNS
jgi:hypothetical protein